MQMAVLKTSNMTSDTNEIEASAAAWAMRVDAGALTSAEQSELDAWLACDARHLGAYIRAQVQWQNLERVAALASGVNTQQVVAANPARTIATAIEPPPFWRRREFVAGIVGSLGLAGLGWSVVAPARTVYTTALGEVRRISLEDGSSLVLNSDSEAAVTFSRQLRTIQLLRGEALFEVTRDIAGRPFVLEAQQWRVSASESVFSTRLQGARMDLTVSMGSVELQAQSAAATQPVVKRMLAAQTTVLHESAPITVHNIPPAAVEQRLAWVRGMLAFSGESLQSAVDEFNRHNLRKLVIDDPQLAAQPVVGAFRANDVDGFAAAVAAVMDVEVVETPVTLHLRPRAAS